MALIKCPECGKEISDRAKACPSCGFPIQVEEKSESTVGSSAGIIDSGIVSFSVNAPTIASADLPSRVQEAIASKSTLIRSEGKTIVNINKSDPYSIGGVYTQIDVEIVWNASDTPAYRSKLYDQAVVHENNRNYTLAIPLFEKISDFSDAKEHLNQCRQKAADESNRIVNKLIAEEKENEDIKKQFGKNPAENSQFYFFFVGFLLVCFGGALLGTIGMTLVTQTPRIILGLICFVCIVLIIRKCKQISDYEARVEEYKNSKA